MAGRDHVAADPRPRRPGGPGTERRWSASRPSVRPELTRRASAGPRRADDGDLDPAGGAALGPPRARQPAARPPSPTWPRAGVPPACRSGCSRTTGCPPGSTSRPAGHPTAGPARWTPATPRCARCAGTRCWAGDRRRQRGHRELRGLPGRGPGLLRGPGGRQLQDLLDGAQGRLRRARPRRRSWRLLDELAPEFGTAKVFRPYRDVRFSNDKTPYKTHQGAVVHADGAGTGAWYVQISAEGLYVAGGSGDSRATRSPATAAQWPTTSRVLACRPRSTGWRPRAGRSAARS